MNKTILCEDAHGKSFFERFIKKLKNKEPRKLGIRIVSMKGPFDNKASRAVKAAAINGHVIVVVDAHGKDPLECEGNIRKACDNLQNLSIIVIANCIEEWLVENECLDKVEDPVRYLKTERKYKKSKLPSYAERIDIQKLSNKSSSFRQFLNAINDP